MSDHDANLNFLPPPDRGPILWNTADIEQLRARVAAIDDGPFVRHAFQAELVRIIAGWATKVVLNEGGFPTNEQGFHHAFIRDTKHWKQMRELLISVIRDALVALECLCGVGTILITMQGEQSPKFADEPPHRLFVDSPSVRVFSCRMFCENPQVFKVSFDDISYVARMQLAPSYLQDWRLQSGAATTTATKDAISSPASPALGFEGPPNAQDSYAVSDALRFWITSASPATDTSADKLASRLGAFDLGGGSNSASLSSALASNIGNAGPADSRTPPVPPVMSFPTRAPTLQEVDLSQLSPFAVDLLEALAEPPPVEHVLWTVQISRPESWEMAFTGLGLSPAVARALAHLINTRADSKKKERPKPAPKTDEERAGERALSHLRKQTLNAAVTVAVEAIEKIIDDLADENDISISYASSLVHHGSDNDAREKVLDAVRIIKAGQQEHGADFDYKHLSEDNKATLLTLLQENRDQRDIGVVGNANRQQQDIRTTMDKVALELQNLHNRSHFNYFLISGRTELDANGETIVEMTPAAEKFICLRLDYAPLSLGQSFEVFARNFYQEAGKEASHAIPQAIAKSREVKTKLKTGEIMPDLRAQYQKLTGRDHPRFDWKPWAEGKPDSYGVILRGWPLSEIPPMCLSYIGTNAEMSEIYNAVKTGSCFLEKAPAANIGINTSVAKTRQPNRSRNGAFNSFMNQHGGTLLQFDDEPEVLESIENAPRKSRSSKRKTTEPELDAGKENHLPGSVPATQERPQKRARPIGFQRDDASVSDGSVALIDESIGCSSPSSHSVSLLRTPATTPPPSETPSPTQTMTPSPDGGPASLPPPDSDPTPAPPAPGVAGPTTQGPGTPPADNRDDPAPANGADTLSREPTDGARLIGDGATSPYVADIPSTPPSALSSLNSAAGPARVTAAFEGSPSVLPGLVDQCYGSGDQSPSTEV
ncbi:hypothetical protein BC834DRAFT_846978 [Gloeopeniophorella convolvens]|nr:hypothetical protein BC834DRAFT_846978 [Gloeopeniophorella convolvens]